MHAGRLQNCADQLQVKAFHSRWRETRQTPATLKEMRQQAPRPHHHHAVPVSRPEHTAIEGPRAPSYRW
jgi:hypothetical protein